MYIYIYVCIYYKIALASLAHLLTRCARVSCKHRTLQNVLCPPTCGILVLDNGMGWPVVMTASSYDMKVACRANAKKAVRSRGCCKLDMCFDRKRGAESEALCQNACILCTPAFLCFMLLAVVTISLNCSVGFLKNLCHICSIQK